MYSYSTRVRYTECGSNKKLTLPALIDYFQNCSTFHSEDVGLGVDYLAEHKTAWFLLTWQVVIDRMPSFCDNVKVCTCPYDFKGFYGNRNFWLENDKGGILVKANTIWSYMDVEKGRPVKVPAEQLEAYGGGEKLDMEYAPRKLAVPDTLALTDTIEAVPDMIDTNHHVNNGQYIRIAMRFLAKERPDAKVRQMFAEYRKVAVLGDVFYPYTGWADGRFYVSLRDGQGNVNAAVAFECGE